MRLWTVHPKYLDARGLGAVWREALLALALSGNRHGRFGAPVTHRAVGCTNELKRPFIA